MNIQRSFCATDNQPGRRPVNVITTSTLVVSFLWSGVNAGVMRGLVRTVHDLSGETMTLASPPTALGSRSIQDGRSRLETHPTHARLNSSNPNSTSPTTMSHSRVHYGMCVSNSVGARTHVQVCRVYAPT